MAFSEFPDSAAGLSALRASRQWQLVIHGEVRPNLHEVRCQRIPEAFHDCPRLIIARATEAGQDRVALTLPGAAERSVVHFSDVGEALAQVLDRAATVLIDITSIEVDALLLLMPHLAARPRNWLGATFLAPKRYQLDASRLGTWSEPRQPPGYVTLAPALSAEPRREHWVIAGFDPGRVSRIIGRYDWERERLHAVIGCPPYFPDGASRARAANVDWLSDLSPGDIHEVAAADPAGIQQLLRSRIDAGADLDILPFGPKPLVLGALLFYFSLPIADRAKVRWLYDFPEFRVDHATGVSRCFLYDLTDLSSA